MGEAPLFCGESYFCGESRRQSLRIPIQTRSRSDKNVVDARLDRILASHASMTLAPTFLYGLNGNTEVLTAGSRNSGYCAGVQDDALLKAQDNKFAAKKRIRTKTRGSKKKG